jgi:N6-L-threonylcarbamoyladenine synthase
MTILALETSCDDTCAAVVDCDGRMRSNVISSQEAHGRFGGVVPEIASRHHLELVDVVVREALHRADASMDDVRLVAATQGPGLVGALLVGLSAGKGIAAARELPFAPVDHLQGHVAANFLSDATSGVEAFEPPFLCLVASGGHTLVARVDGHDGLGLLGRTLDDAAGEAFDKGARMLGLGYPGGPALERLATDGDPHAFAFPGSSGERTRAASGAGRKTFADSLDFSFAGLKTSLLYTIRDLGEEPARRHAADLAASYQEAIVGQLLQRVLGALARTGLQRVAVGGGVAANGRLRERLRELDVMLHVPERSLCTDNAAMIASAARFGRRLPYPEYLPLDAYATGERAA